MSWFGKWFKLEPVVTQEDFERLVELYTLQGKRLDQLHIAQKQLMERLNHDYQENNLELNRLKSKVEVLLDRPIAQQIHNPNTYVGNVRDVREPAAMVDVTDSSSSSSD